MQKKNLDELIFFSHYGKQQYATNLFLTKSMQRLEVFAAMWNTSFTLPELYSVKDLLQVIDDGGKIFQDCSLGKKTEKQKVHYIYSENTKQYNY